MRTRLMAIAAVTAVAALPAAVAAAQSFTTQPFATQSSAKQHVAIEVRNGTSFDLTAFTPGAIKADSGRATFCCWTDRHTTQGGQPVDVNNPQMTLIGKRGTIVARNQIGWTDVPDGLAVFTGTWKVIRGTGVYAGLAGGGRGAGVQLANTDTKSQFDGFLSLK
jgi:hypothetical protein